MPKKYQPDFPYLRKVPIARVHLFTVCQLGCFVMLWLVKEISTISIFFPIMVSGSQVLVVVIIGIKCPFKLVKMRPK